MHGKAYPDSRRGAPGDAPATTAVVITPPGRSPRGTSPLYDLRTLDYITISVTCYLCRLTPGITNKDKHQYDSLYYHHRSKSGHKVDIALDE